MARRIAGNERDERRDALITTRKAAMSPVKVALARQDMTQADLVRQLDRRAHLSISQQTLSNYLNGHARIDRDMLIWICVITGTSEQTILSSVSDESIVLQTVKRPLRYQRHAKPADKNQEPPR